MSSRILFSSVLNMSMTASIMILLIIAVRFAIKKLPKKMHMYFG